MPRLILWILPLLLAACSIFQRPEPGPTIKLRPSGTPDVVIIGFAGRCASITLQPCNPPFDNWSYLQDRGTQQAVIDAFNSLGYTTEYFNASAYLYRHYSRVSKREDLGYLEAEAYLNRVVKDWVADYANPTRIVLLAHSHGTVWASLLAWNHPDVKFDYFISLDGICFWWPEDNLKKNRIIESYYDPLGLRRPWPLNPEEGETACASKELDGKDVNDVFPENVYYGLEAISKDVIGLNVNYLQDHDPNIRADGSKRRIWTIKSRTEDHSEVTNPAGPAMHWVADAIKALKVPKDGEAVPRLIQLVPQNRSFVYY